MTEIFDEDDSFTGPPLDDELVRRVEQSLGMRLPRSYVELLRTRNGGALRRSCCPTGFPTSWAEDHFEIQALKGVGGEWGIDAADFGSAYAIEEWRYPDIGIVICEMPSGGHDAVILDYSECGAQGEPVVAYIDEDRVPRRVASSFEEFMAGLVDRGNFGD
jgi:hypothetical protein